jgi:type VI protein secretion system component VasK
MQQFFLALVLILGGMSYWLYTENQKLIENNAKLMTATQLQEETISQLQNDMQLQTESLLNLQSKNQEIELEMNRYLDIFKRHNLTKLAAAKPGLIESRANKATKEVFDGIEQDSRDIDAADDSLIVQPVANEDIRG